MLLPFAVHARDPGCAARRATVETSHGAIETPAFMTVGTRATVTGLDPDDLAEVGTQVVLGNTYHLMLQPGAEAFERGGGLHRFMGWDGPVLTDSGGFQIFSLKEERTINERGARFRSYIDQRVELLTPERSIAIQTALGSDIMMVLDECPDARADEPTIRAAMERTHRWAARSLEARTSEQALFAIVQGGVVPALRRESSDVLRQMPFDGYALGGLAVGDTRTEREAITGLAAELLPPERPRYLMGVGTPADLLVAIRAGIDMFDCMLPTHLAWQGTAFTSTGRVKITRGAYRSADVPLDLDCPCRTCTQFSRSYLHHLFRCKEPLGYRLLSIHNLTHYNRLMASARAAIEAGTYDAFARDTLERIDRHEHSAHRLGAQPGGDA
ncbi:MAG: tRNA guanosine(34) transglycosylase Tgt [Sandaracinaceae bacterium]